MEIKYAKLEKKKKKAGDTNAILGSIGKRDCCQAGRDSLSSALYSYAALIPRKIKKLN